MCEYILKVRQYRICNGNDAKLFLFFKLANIPHKAQNKTHCVVIKLSIQGTMLLSRWRWPCTLWQILYKRKKERFVVLATFWKNDNSSRFWHINSFNWKSSFVLIYYKSEDGYPTFLFSYLLLIALNTNSTYIIWLKKIFCSILFSKFLTRDYILFFVSSSSIADSGTVSKSSSFVVISIVLWENFSSWLEKNIIIFFFFCSFIY